jgi:hypothetical protein
MFSMRKSVRRDVDELSTTSSREDNRRGRRKKNCPRVAKENRICSDCGSRETPIWRYSDDGRLLCNACGVYAKKNKQKRSVDSLKRKRPTSSGKPGSSSISAEDSENASRYEANEQLSSAAVAAAFYNNPFPSNIFP